MRSDRVRRQRPFALGSRCWKTTYLKKEVWVLILMLASANMFAQAARINASDAPSTIPGDINGDGAVDILDAVLISNAFDTTPNDPHWNGNADLNGDDVVDILDATIIAVHFGESTADRQDGILAGWRSSPSEYQQEVEPAYWVDAANNMASKISNSVARVFAGGVWILGETLGHRCFLTLPSSEAYPNIVFSEQDQNERYLDAFDAAGLKVWLQVEPADADVETLIDLVLGRYHQHPCVIGFGVDVEWLEAEEYTDGRAVSSEEAQMWLERVKSFDPGYRLFLKHWLAEKMPTYRDDGLVFMCDSQEYGDMLDLVDDFKQWGKRFSDSEVCFQIGYASDEDWWSQLSDPFMIIADRLCGEIPNCSGVYWVDFTLPTIYPLGDGSIEDLSINHMS